MNPAITPDLQTSVKIQCPPVVMSQETINVLVNGSTKHYRQTYKQRSTKHYTDKHTNNDLPNTTKTNIQTMIYKTLHRQT